MNLSAIVTTKNEEKNIGRCIRSLRFAGEVIVVDDFSQDATVTIAEKSGARVIQNSWEGYGQQKNVGLAHAQYDWILFIDADEEVPLNLAREIEETLKNPQYKVYWLRIIDIFLGQPLRHLIGHNPRLMRRGQAAWTQRAVHEQIVYLPENTLVRLGDARSAVLSSLLTHHGHDSVKSYLRKMHRYTTLDAKQMLQARKHRSGRTITANIALPFLLAARQFIKLAFWRRGILDGYQGLLWSTLSAYYEWEMGWKFLRLHTKT